jgi:hypothetical protein
VTGFFQQPGAQVVLHFKNFCFVDYEVDFLTLSNFHAFEHREINLNLYLHISRLQSNTEEPNY